MNKKNIDRQIIAIGGGGFGRDPKHNKIEKYSEHRSNKKTKRVYQ